MKKHESTPHFLTAEQTFQTIEWFWYRFPHKTIDLCFGKKT